METLFVGSESVNEQFSVHVFAEVPHRLAGDVAGVDVAVFFKDAECAR